MHIWTHRWRWLHNKLWLMHGSHVIKYQIFSFVYIRRCCSYSCDWCRCTLSCRITLNDKIQGVAFDCSTRRWWGETCAIRHGSNLHSTWTLKEFVKRYVNKYNVRNKMYQHLVWQEQQYYGHADKEGKPDGFITCNKDSVNQGPQVMTSNQILSCLTQPKSISISLCEKYSFTFFLYSCIS